VTFATVAENLRESFRIIAANRQNGEIRELQGVSIAAAGVVFQMFNAAFLSARVESEADLAQRILVAALHFQARGYEWAYWLCEDYLAPKALRRSHQVFERHGMRHSVDLPGMVAERLEKPARHLPSIEIRRVCDEPTREAFCNIGSVCFHVPLAWFCEVFGSGAVWNDFEAYVGYVAGEPVSTAAVIKGGGAIGVYNVATLPHYQRHGYGEAVMRYAVREAQQRHGIERTILQSTPAGYRLYERMGFRTITRVAVYSS
jgi:ribosomal protein S18 acetylase RimI-like enzyme